jgi:hypothetical protein
MNGCAPMKRPKHAWEEFEEESGVLVGMGGEDQQVFDPKSNKLNRSGIEIDRNV